MILEIDETLYNDLLNFTKNNNSIYTRLKSAKIAKQTAIEKARDTKTANIKETIKKAIKSLYKQNITPTKYQVNKRTGIAYVTLKKYYDEIIKDIDSTK